MRDIVHMTRLAQALYDEKDVQQKRNNLDELLDWLGTLPEIERKWMGEEIVKWVIYSKQPGVFPYEIIHGITLLPPIAERDQKVCREFRQSLLTRHSEAKDDLNMIESRRKAAQKRFEELRKHREREKDFPEIEDDPFGSDDGIQLVPDSEN